MTLDDIHRTIIKARLQGSDVGGSTRFMTALVTLADAAVALAMKYEPDNAKVHEALAALEAIPCE